MPSKIVTQIDNSVPEIKDGEFFDVYLDVPANQIYLKGTIMARAVVGSPVTTSAIVGTGNGTLTALALAFGSNQPVTGVYALKCTAVVGTNGSTWTLTDPNGLLLQTISVPDAPGGLVDFTGPGVAGRLTDGSTNFVVNDQFNITVTADAKWVPYNVGNSPTGANVAAAVLTYDLPVDTVVRNVRGRLLIAGQVDRSQLKVQAGTAVTDALVESLRDYGIVALPVVQLSVQET